MYPPSLSYEEMAARRRKNIRRAALGLIGITVLSLTAWIYFKEVEPRTPLLNNVVVFALVNLNIILLMVLVLLVLRNLVRLYYSTRSGPGGSRLQVKLVLAFVGFTLIPSVALFVVASGLIDKSINSLFDIKVEGALKGSFEVAQTYYREAERNSLGQAKLLAKQIEALGEGALKDPKRLTRFLAERRAALRLDAVRVFRADREEVASALRPQAPDGRGFSAVESLLQEVLAGEARSSVESAGEVDVIHGVAPLRWGQKAAGFVVVSQFVSERLVEKVKGIFKAYEDYKEFELSKSPIKASYIITFLLITLVILFSAIWYGFYIARGITVAIEKLAEGTRAVSEGDLDHRVDVEADGEVGILVAAFNQMTQELKGNKRKIEEAADSLQRSNVEIDRRRRYMEAMLENIGTGVVSTNRRGRVTIVNEAAGDLLHIDPRSAVGRPFNEVFQNEHLAPIRRLLRTMRDEGRESASEQVEMMLEGRVLTLRASLTLLRNAEGRNIGAVVVFDDLSALIRAQRVAAWREVAQGIAHEIKNPLTPIQLSAQRMRRKFEQNAEDFSEVFEACTETIIHQVQGLMELVNEFSRFARLPEARLRPCPLSPLLEQVVALYRDRRPDVALRAELPGALPLVMADAEQLQRVFINLLENAFECMEEKEGEVLVLAFADEERSQLVVEVADQGRGIPEDIKGEIFFPYFSTKNRGSGLGLAICHRVVTDHNGSITVRDNLPRGAVFRVTLPFAPASAVPADLERTAVIG
ncbi:MAG: ATP-binding protein [bacterium]